MTEAFCCIRRKVINIGEPVSVEEFIYEPDIQNRALYKFCTTWYVILESTGKIIQHDNFLSQPDAFFCNVRTNESRAASY